MHSGVDGECPICTNGGVGRKRSSGSPENRVLGARVELAREQAGLSRQELAEKLGVDVSLICRIEAGRVALSAVRALEIAAVLKLPIGDLYADPRLAS